jgi:hypothetical protein
MKIYEDAKCCKYIDLTLEGPMRRVGDAAAGMAMLTVFGNRILTNIVKNGP